MLLLITDPIKVDNSSKLKIVLYQLLIQLCGYTDNVYNCTEASWYVMYHTICIWKRITTTSIAYAESKFIPTIPKTGAQGFIHLGQTPNTGIKVDYLVD